MAERTVTLTMTPSEEIALATLIGYLCIEQAKSGELEAILGERAKSVDAIGRINAALNSNR